MRSFIVNKKSTSCKVDSKIILTQLDKKDTLEYLLAGSPKAKLSSHKEDSDWIDAEPKGREI